MNNTKQVNIDKLMKSFLDTCGKKRITYEFRDPYINVEMHGNRAEFLVKQYNSFLNNPPIDVLQNDKKKLLVFCRKISGKTADYFIENEISFITEEGNCVIISENMFILIETKSKKTKVESSGIAFEKKGLRLIFQLLIDENYLNLSYRKISTDLRISLGSVSNVINALLNNQMIIETEKKNKTMRDHKQLLQKWITFFGNKLKPELFIGKYKKLDISKELNLTGSSCFGGESAAEKVQLPLKAEIETVYVEDVVTFIKANKLIPDDNGKIELYQKFWISPVSEKSSTCPYILIYADLLLSNVSRNIEIAKELYEEYL